MENQNNETGPLLLKLVIYAGGVMIGLAAKLATLNMEKPITWPVFLFHTAVALACAWVVYFAFRRAGMDDMAIVASVIVGRFGDSLLMAIARGIRKTILNLFQSNEP
jgi:hypothetical protein